MQTIIWLFFIFCLIFLLFILVYYSPFILKKKGERQLQKYCSNHGILVITFDDGPSHLLTTKLIKVLKDANATATFFVLGTKAEQHYSVINMVMQAGHEVGCHGFKHINYWKVSPRKALNDITRGYQSLSFFIKKEAIFRPPYGKLTLITWLALKRHKRPIGWWTHVSGDTCMPLRPIDNVLKDLEKKNGGVVLLHDFDRSPKSHPACEEFVINSTKKLIQLANQKQWRVKKLSEVIELASEKHATSSEK